VISRFDQLADSIFAQVNEMRPADGSCIVLFPRKPECRVPTPSDPTDT
jgi:hypothetical protein